MNRNGFTLVEILVVVVLLGIIAAIIVPQFSGAGIEARKSALLNDLRRVRSQIEFYKFQHNDQLPAVTGESSDDFVRRITTQTNIDGDAGIDFGPYLQTIPINPFNDLNSVRVDGAAAGNGTGGWRYDTATGAFDADDSVEHAAF